MLNGRLDYLGDLVRENYIRVLAVDPFDEGAYASYNCHDEIPYNDIGKALAEAERYPIQHHMNIPWILVEKAACDAWDVPAGGSVQDQPVVSEVPTLLFSGELDPVTPADWALRTSRHLVNSRSIVWPNIAHSVVFVSECADRVAGAFLSNPLADPFVIGCVDEEIPLLLVSD